MHKYCDIFNKTNNHSNKIVVAGRPPPESATNSRTERERPWTRLTEEEAAAVAEVEVLEVT